MKRKKRLAAGIILFLLAVCMAGCKADRKEIVLNIKVPPLPLTSEELPEIRDVGDMLEQAGEDFSAQYKEADVKVNVVTFDYTKEDRFITDCFDTPDAADIRFGRYFNVSSYIHSGRVIPLDGILTEEMKEDIAPEYWDMSRLDGRNYMLPFYDIQNTLCYNRELFRQCGLEEYTGEENTIQSWTSEEFDTILATLREKLPDMAYPLMMYARNEQGDTHIMSLLRGRGCPVVDENGRFCLNTPEGIEALKWISDSREKGYFPGNCEDMEEEDCQELFRSGQLAICMINNVSLSGYEEKERENIGLANFPSEDGKGYTTRFTSGFQVFDNGSEEKLEAAKAFLKYFYSQEIYMNCARKGIPVCGKVAEDVRAENPLMRAYMDNTAETVDFAENNPNWRGVRSIFYTQIHRLLEGGQSPEETAEAIDRECNAAIALGWKNSKFHK